MMRVTEQGTQRLREEIEAGDRRIADIERRGFELDQEHRSSIAESQAQQDVNNRRYQELKGTDNKDAKIQLAYDQINFDYLSKLKKSKNTTQKKGIFASKQCKNFESKEQGLFNTLEN